MVKLARIQKLGTTLVFLALLTLLVLKLNLSFLGSFSLSHPPLRSFFVNGGRYLMKGNWMDPPTREGEQRTRTNVSSGSVALVMARAVTPRVMVKASTSRKTTGKPKGKEEVAISPEALFRGDVYATDETYLHSGCPDNIRARVLNIPEYKEVFLGTVPVLQWSKHATAAEYQRLSKYNGVHGWMVIEYEDLKDSLSCLNTSANTVLFDDWELRPNKSSNCIRCAVIGNGGILNNSNMGEEIDKHDYVFRVNGAITKGFEKDVGQRTSFYTFSTNTLMNSLYAYGRLGYTSLPMSEETRYLFLPDHNRDYYLVRAAITHSLVDKGRDKSKDPKRYFGSDTRPEKFKIYHPDFLRYIRNRFLWSAHLRPNNWNIYRTSTGAAMLLAAMHTCDQVSAYGFMTPDYAKYSDHYFDRKYNVVHFYANHNMKMEMKLWKKLHEYGLIKLYTRL